MSSVLASLSSSVAKTLLTAAATTSSSTAGSKGVLSAVTTSSPALSSLFTASSSPPPMFRSVFNTPSSSSTTTTTSSSSKRTTPKTTVASGSSSSSIPLSSLAAFNSARREVTKSSNGTMTESFQSAFQSTMHSKPDHEDSGHKPPLPLTPKSKEDVAPLWAKNKAIKDEIDGMLRVDHAGEYGAIRIYAGQLAVLGNTPDGPMIREMYKEEQNHLDAFNKTLVEYRVRPTVLLPAWHVAGWLLGWSSAMMGREAAMACTVAVETVIGKHYNEQLGRLMELGVEDEYLSSMVRSFRDDELHHLDVGMEQGAATMPFFKLYSQAIELGCNAAIYVSTRV